MVDISSKTRELHPDGTTGTTGTTTMPCQGFEGLDYPEICRWDFPRELQRSSVKCTIKKKKTYAVGIFPFQSNFGSWRSPIDSMGISVLLRREDWTPWNSWDKFGAPKKLWFFCVHLVHQRPWILCKGYMFSSSKNGHVFFQGFDMDLFGEMWSHEIDVPGIKLDM